MHWQESGRGRPGVRDLPAAHILGIQPVRGTGKQGKGGSGGGDSKRVDGQAPEGSDNVVSTPGAESSTNRNQNTNTSTPVTPPASSSPCLGLEGSGVPSIDTAGRSETQTLSGGKAKETVIQGDSVLTDSKEEPGPGGGAMADVTPPPPEPTGRVEETVGTGRTPQQIREEGWSLQGSENVTLAELYLMLGKPGKLQLEYEWQPKPRPSAIPTTQRVLRCLLRLVTSEVNPKPVSCFAFLNLTKSNDCIIFF